jgi:N-acyl-L-homoserine lactone synthetase
MMTGVDVFRKHVFVGRLGWSLPQIGGVERDKYDGADTVYVAVSDATDSVTACARLLPTTGPYMLPEIFPQLLGGAKAPRHPGTWELSRFATSVRSTGKGRVLSLSEPTLELLEAVFVHSRSAIIDRLVLATTIGIERLMLRTGLVAHRLGPPVLMDGAYWVALFIEVPKTPIAGAHSVQHGRTTFVSDSNAMDRIIRPIEDVTSRTGAAYSVASGA